MTDSYLFHMYLNKIGFEGKFISISLSTKTGSPVCEIRPSESCTEEELIQMQEIAATYNWGQPDFWVPQVEEFISQVFDALPPQGKLILSPYLNMLRTYINEPYRVKEMWSLIKASKFDWMTPEVEEQIVIIASKTNVVIE